MHHLGRDRHENNAATNANTIKQQQQQQEVNDANETLNTTVDHLASTRTWALDSRNNTNTPNMKRPFDVVIFGASGSIGKFLVEELALVVDKYYSSTSPSSSSTSTALFLGGKTLSEQSSVGRDVSRQNQQPQLRAPNQFSQQQNNISESARRQSVPRQSNDIRWAIAGRSAVKLSETLCRAELSTGIRDLSTQISVILADLNHKKSLLDMCQKTQLVINCVGPYSDQAEPLVSACLECGTNYIDLAHETTFIELIRQKYSARAKQAGIFIIQGCGFQAMSTEMGLNYTKQVADGEVNEIKIILSVSDFKAHPGSSSKSSLSSASPNCVDGRSWTTTIGEKLVASASSIGLISLGMWHSLLNEKSREIPVEARLLQAAPVDNKQATFNSLNNTTIVEEINDQVSSATGDLDNENEEQSSQVGLLSPPSRARRHPNQLERQDTQTLVKNVVQFRNKNSVSWFELFNGFTQNGRGYCCPIDSLTSEEAQLIRGEMNNYELRRPDLNSDQGWRPIRCTSFMSMKSLFEICFALVWIQVFNLLVKWSPFRLIMRNFPTICSLGHVNSYKRELERDSLAHIKFCQTFIAYGTPGDNSGDPLEQRDRNKMRKQMQLLISRIVGPEPNHVATSTYAIQAAITLLLERDHLPSSGGVITPGAAFSETNIIYQLKRRNIKFEVLKKA